MGFKRVNKIPHSSFLGAMDARIRSQFLACGTRKAWPASATVFAQGEAGQSMLVLSSGRAEISRMSVNGTPVIVGYLGPGDVVGELALLDKSPRSASVVAATPLTGILISFENVEQFLLDHPRVMMSMLIDLAGKLRVANELAESRSLASGGARLARCLLDLTVRWGIEDEPGTIRIQERFSQATLGRLSNLSRENVNRHLSRWEKAGVISRGAGWLTLRDVEFMQHRASDDPA